MPLFVGHPSKVQASTPPAYQYTKTFDTTAGAAFGNGVATDAQGNIYVVGQFTGTVVFDGTGGSDSQTNGGSQGAFLTKYNANGTYAYTKTFDTSSGGARATGVATDAQGNIFITGRFVGTVIFDGTGGTDSQTDSGSVQDAYLTKYSANGSYAFTKTFDTSSGDASGSGVATDPQGNIYMVGTFDGTVIFDGASGSDSQTSAIGGTNSYITKYNANGSYGYTKVFDGSGTAVINGVTTDSQGNIYATGSFSGTIIFDGTGGTDSQTSSNNAVFLTKYNANGTYGYTKIFDTSASGAQAAGNGVSTDTLGNVYVAGNFTGTVVFDGTGGTDSQTSANTDALLTKYNANGSYAYTKTFDDSASGGFVVGSGVDTDSFGNVYMTGYFDGTVVFDGTGGTDSQTAANGGEDFFVTKYNANASYGWTTTSATPVSGAYGDTAGIAIDPAGGIYVTGVFSGTLTFDGTGGTDTRTTASSSTFLTSFRVLAASNPVVPTPPRSNPGAAVTAGAPNTGHGTFTASPLHSFVLYGLISLGLAGLAVVVRKLS